MKWLLFVLKVALSLSRLREEPKICPLEPEE